MPNISTREIKKLNTGFSFKCGREFVYLRLEIEMDFRAESKLPRVGLSLALIPQSISERKKKRFGLAN